MTTRTLAPCAALIAMALWWLAARALPMPALPWDPQTMSLDQIRMAFGLMPRGVIALLAGAMLGLSGAILQVVLRNPVADPTTLGISAGAQLALVLAMVGSLILGMGLPTLPAYLIIVLIMGPA